ncbi:MAG: hypothetical protein ACK58O_01095 [Brevundimonas sp.]
MEPTSYEPTASGPVDLESNLARAPEAPDPAGPDRLERAHISLKDAVERLLAESRHGDFIEATHLVRHATHLLQTLDPAALEPSRGLAGLFDGRGARLKRFRAQYLPAAASAGDTAAALAERGRSAVRRSAALDALHAEAVRAIAEVDAAIAEGEAKLREVAAPVPGPAEATVENEEPLPGPEASRSETLDAAEAVTRADFTTVGAVDVEDPATATVELDAAAVPLPGPEAGRIEVLDTEDALAIADAVPAGDDPAGATARLEVQLAALRAARAAGLAQLPLARAVQNAEHAAPARLADAAAALSTWVEDWRQGLGLAGRKPRQIRPDAVALARTRDSALEALAQTDRQLAAIRTRAGETESRMTRVVEQIRRVA